MKRKKYLLLFIISFCLLISKPYALTIRETMDENDEYSTIEEGSIVIGATRFSPDNIITASKAATAGVNDAMLHVLRTGTTEGYQNPKVYYYVDSYVGWFYIDSENQVQTVTDEEELESLSKLDIYYVDNQEKVLEVDYPHDDIKEDTLPKGVTYKNNKLYINATVEKVEFKTIDEKKVSYLMDKTTSSFIEDIRSCFTVNNNKITDYDPSCGNDLIIPTEINGITITSIGPNAFKNTNLVNVVIPNTITSIGDNAFANNNLEKVIIKDKYSQEEFTNYGNNIFGEFNNVIYDNILTRILNNLDNDYIIKYYKNYDINPLLDENNDDYRLSGYIVNSLIKKVENNGYSKKYEYCGENCDYFERLELDELKETYGLGIEEIDELKYKVTIQNYDNNKINKISKIIDISFKESGTKNNNDIVLDALKNLEYNDNDQIVVRMKQLQDLEDIYNIDIILHKRGCGGGPNEDETIVNQSCGYSTYYEKDNVLYQSNIVMIKNTENSYFPIEKLEDYESLDIYIENIINLFTIKTGITNYEFKVQENGLIYRIDKENNYYSYETAKTYIIEILDKEYLENWSIYFLEFYDDRYNQDGYTEETCFEFNNGIITDYDGTCGINVRIPQTINGIDVIEIGNNTFSYMKLAGVYLPLKLKKIGNRAFVENNLDWIELPSELVEIGEYAFGWNKIPEIKLHDSIEKIGDGAFIGNQIEIIKNFGNNIQKIGDSAFSNNKIKEIEIPSGITTIGINVFSYNEIETLILPEGLEQIGEKAFANNKIKNLELPSTLRKLGQAAFTNNQLSDENAFIYNLKVNEETFGYVPDYESINSYAGANRDNVVIPDDVLFISDYAFYDCGIKKVKLPISVLQIGSYSFSNNELTSIDIPYGTNLIGDNAFAYNKLTFVVVPDSTKNLGYLPFEGNLLEGENSFVYTKNENNRMDYTTLVGYYNTVYTVDEIIIPDTVKKIGDGAFQYCETKKLVIPYGVEEIGNSSFSRVSITKELSIPKSVTKIGQNAFSENYRLSEEEGYIYGRNEDGTIDNSILMAYIAYIKDGSLTIPKGVVELSENIFYDEYNLNEVILPSTLKKIGKNAFRSNHNLEKVLFNNELEIIGDYAFSNTNLKTITLGNYIQSIGKKAFEYNSNLTSVSIGIGPTIIGDYAFQYNQNLTSLTLGNNIQSIGDYAFYNNNLTSVNIPGTVKTIGEYAFAWNDLREIKLGEGIETIKTYAFNINDQLKEVTIPSTVINLGNYVFGQNLEKVMILGKSSESEFTTYGDNPFGYNVTIIYELFEPTLELPSLPLEIHYYDSSYSNIEMTYKITDIWYDYKDKNTLTITIAVNKIYDILGNDNKESGSLRFNLRSKNNGNTVATKTYDLPVMSVNNSFKTSILIDNLPIEDLILDIEAN